MNKKPNNLNTSKLLLTAIIAYSSLFAIIVITLLLSIKTYINDPQQAMMVIIFLAGLVLIDEITICIMAGYLLTQKKVQPVKEYKEWQSSVVLKVGK